MPNPYQPPRLLNDDPPSSAWSEQRAEKHGWIALAMWLALLAIFLTTAYSIWAGP